ncbi:MAG: hypothetical protein KGS47_13240 [Chloroflexi bacterium]|nr:hypothetical protein [Chloroflexota bacterium]
MNAWVLCMALGLAHAGSMDLVQARLARGDAAGAREALRGVPEPVESEAGARAAWLDANARVAWAAGEMDRAFALGVQAQVLAERAAVELPPLTGGLGPKRAWVDAACGIPLRALPTGDAGAQAASLAATLVALPEAGRPGGAWIACAARLLDASRPMPAAERPKEGRESPAQARARLRGQLLRAACEARTGEARSAERVLADLRQVARQAREAAPFMQWFEGELLLRDTPRRDARLASLRFTQSAAASDDAPWLRVAALRRAADAVQAVDPQEAARLRAAADKEIP